MDKDKSYYIDKFKLAQPNFEFDRNAFLTDFGEAFMDKIENHICHAPTPMDYNQFKRVVDEHKALYNQLSSSREKPLSEGLWGAFFAKYVVPLRKLMFNINNQSL